MSVSSIGLQNLNLDIDEDKLFIVPNIKVNKGGQIIEINDSGSTDNITIQTTSLLQDTENILNGVGKVLGNLQPQVAEIALQITSLENQVNALIPNVQTLLTQIETLVSQIGIATVGSVPIIATYDKNQAVTAMKNINEDAGLGYLKRRQKLSLANITLPAGIYVVNHNFTMISIIVNTISTQLNDSTRFLLTYAFVDITNGGNICSSLNCCSGHDALAIIHASSMCFQLDAETEVNIGLMFDVDAVDKPTFNDITYSFTDFQASLYPYLTNTSNNVNENILQVIRIA